MDYCIIPYDLLNLFKELTVIRANDLLNLTGLDRTGIDLRLIPDHSLIKWCFDIGSFMSDYVLENESDEALQFNKFDFKNIPADFMNTENVNSDICLLIKKQISEFTFCMSNISPSNPTRG